jgi:hypothetical protein
MNAKLWAVVAVMIVTLSASGLLLEGNSANRDDKIVITARVNVEGSGIFYGGDPTELVNRDGVNFAGFNKEGWKGKIFMTPGETTIQHTMLAEIVNDFGEGWRFLENDPGNNPSGNCVFYQIVTPNNMKKTFNNGIPGLYADGGIIWESYYTDILVNSSRSVSEVVQTGEIAPDHACCVVAVNRTFAENSPEAVSRFLAAYTVAVDWVINALAHPSTSVESDYYELVTIAMEYTNASNRAAVEDAFSNVKYLYEIGELRNDIANLVTQYQGLAKNPLRFTPEELGFEDTADFANWLVDDKYLESSRYIRLHPEELSDWKSIDLAVLTGDIHQVAAQVAKVKGIFRDYKVSVNLFEQTAGGDVMKQLIAGNVDIGFCGAPPAVINTINMFR